METKQLVDRWFQAWDEGDYLNIPVTENFKHTSPYGTIQGKETYLGIVKENVDKFLGNRIDIHDTIYENRKGCVRYTITNKDFTMEVTEWIYSNGDLIEEIVSYYNIDGEISESRKLSGLN